MPGADALAISVREVHKRFKGREILKGVSLDVPFGTVAIVQGPNGVGKTTLLRILATVITADEGTASVAGFDLRRQAARVREQIGVAFVNERSIYWRLNARENLKLFAATRGVPKAERAQQIDRLAEELDMTPFLESRISELSAGQRQRIILARAGLGDPRVLLIDEPLRGLDEDGTDRAINFIERRAREGGAALVVAPTIREFENRGLPLYRLIEGAILPEGART